MTQYFLVLEAQQHDQPCLNANPNPDPKSEIFIIFRVFGRGGKGVPVPDGSEGEDLGYPPSGGPSLIAASSPSRCVCTLSMRICGIHVFVSLVKN